VGIGGFRTIAGRPRDAENPSRPARPPHARRLQATLTCKDKLRAAASAARRLAGLLRKEDTGELATVLAEMAGTPLARFAEGLKRDAAAVQNALELPWTTSPVEGQVNRIKTLKRAMYGRAGFDLLRRRVLLVT
jgi:transposase